MTQSATCSMTLSWLLSKSVAHNCQCRMFSFMVCQIREFFSESFRIHQFDIESTLLMLEVPDTPRNHPTRHLTHMSLPLDIVLFQLSSMRSVCLIATAAVSPLHHVTSPQRLIWHVFSCPQEYFSKVCLTQLTVPSSSQYVHSLPNNLYLV